MCLARQLKMVQVYRPWLHEVGQDGAPGSWFWPGPATTVTVIWEVNQQMVGLFPLSLLSWKLYLSGKERNLYKVFFFKAVHSEFFMLCFFKSFILKIKMLNASKISFQIDINCDLNFLSLLVIMCWCDFSPMHNQIQVHINMTTIEKKNWDRFH